MSVLATRQAELLAEIRAARRDRNHAMDRYFAALQAARDAGVAVADIAQAAGTTRQNVYGLTVHPVTRARYRKEAS
jgi:hypothetical protein